MKETGVNETNPFQSFSRDSESFFLGFYIKLNYGYVLLRGCLHDSDKIIILFHGMLSRETFDEVTVRVLLFLFVCVEWERRI